MRRNYDIGNSVKNIFDNKNILVTGASGGIGFAIAKKFIGCGASVYLTGRNQARLESHLRGLAIPSERRIVASSASLPTEVDQLVANVRKEFDTVDVLVNAAGLFFYKNLEDSVSDDFEKIFSINVKTPFLLMKEFSRDMVQKGWGRIINIGSTSSFDGYPETSLYCASKHALLGLSRSIYMELKHYNVRTYCFSPGSVKTEMGRLVKGANYENFIDADELAEFIVNAVSFDSNMVTEEVTIRRLNI